MCSERIVLKLQPSKNDLKISENWLCDLEKKVIQQSEIVIFFKAISGWIQIWRLYGQSMSTGKVVKARKVSN